MLVVWEAAVHEVSLKAAIAGPLLGLRYLNKTPEWVPTRHCHCC